MGYKNLCLDCKKVFNQGTDYQNIRKAKCPDCAKFMIQMNHKFRAPKKDQKAKWETVKYLIAHGFFYHHISENNETTWVQYPEKIREAKEFVIRYKSQSLKPDQVEEIMGDVF